MQDLQWQNSDSPIVCVVLVLDSWNHCSEEQAWQLNICKIAQSSLYSWTMYKNQNKRRCNSIRLIQGCVQFWCLNGISEDEI